MLFFFKKNRDTMFNIQYPQNLYELQDLSLLYNFSPEDGRRAVIPDDNYLQLIINGTFPYPYLVNNYSSSYEVNPTVSVGNKYFRNCSKTTMSMSMSIIRMFDEIIIVGKDIIIELGSILGSKKITLKASNSIKLLDSENTAVRTTFLATEYLKINTRSLEIDGADIYPPRWADISTERFDFKNYTKCSSWIIDFMENSIK